MKTASVFAALLVAAQAARARDGASALSQLMSAADLGRPPAAAAPMTGVRAVEARLPSAISARADGATIRFGLEGDLTENESAELSRLLSAFPLKKALSNLAAGDPEHGEPAVRFRIVSRSDLDRPDATVFGTYDRVENVVRIARGEGGSLLLQHVKHELYHAVDDALMTGSSQPHDSAAMSDSSALLTGSYLALLERCGGAPQEPFRANFSCYGEYFGAGNYGYAATPREFFVFHLEVLEENRAWHLGGSELTGRFPGTPLEAAFRRLIESGGVDAGLFSAGPGTPSARRGP